MATTATDTSFVRLSLFCLYKVVERSGGKPKSVEVLYGASDARVREDGHIELLAGSAPFRSDALSQLAIPPYSGLFALYGHKDEAEEMRHWRVLAHEIGAQFACVSFNVAVGDIHVGFVKPEMIAASESMFLNMRRATTDVQMSLLRPMRRLIEDEGGDPSAEMGHTTQMANRPDLFVKAFLADPALARVPVVVISVADDRTRPGFTRQAAFVRAGVGLGPEMLQLQPEASLLIPAWLTDKPLADRLAAEESAAQG